MLSLSFACSPHQSEIYISFTKLSIGNAKITPESCRAPANGMGYVSGEGEAVESPFVPVSGGRGHWLP